MLLERPRPVPEAGQTKSRLSAVSEHVKRYLILYTLLSANIASPAIIPMIQPILATIYIHLETPMRKLFSQPVKRGLAPASTSNPGLASRKLAKTPTELRKQESLSHESAIIEEGH